MFTGQSGYGRRIGTGEITHSAVTMHFVDAAYDRGRHFLRSRSAH